MEGTTVVDEYSLGTFDESATELDVIKVGVSLHQRHEACKALNLCERNAPACNRWNATTSQQMKRCICLVPASVTDCQD